MAAPSLGVGPRGNGSDQEGQAARTHHTHRLLLGRDSTWCHLPRERRKSTRLVESLWPLSLQVWMGLQGHSVQSFISCIKILFILNFALCVCVPPEILHLMLSAPLASPCPGAVLSQRTHGCALFGVPLHLVPVAAASWVPLFFQTVSSSIPSLANPHSRAWTWHPALLFISSNS